MTLCISKGSPKTLRTTISTYLTKSCHKTQDMALLMGSTNLAQTLDICLVFASLSSLTPFNIIACNLKKQCQHLKRKYVSSEKNYVDKLTLSRSLKDLKLCFLCLGCKFHYEKSKELPGFESKPENKEQTYFQRSLIKNSLTRWIILNSCLKLWYWYVWKILIDKWKTTSSALS